jgi:hypothetical protein
MSSAARLPAYYHQQLQAHHNRLRAKLMLLTRGLDLSQEGVLLSWLGSPRHIGLLTLLAVRPILAAGRSSPRLLVWCTGQAVRCATCRFWPVTDPY